MNKYRIGGLVFRIYNHIVKIKLYNAKHLTTSHRILP